MQHAIGWYQPILIDVYITYKCVGSFFESAIWIELSLIDRLFFLIRVFFLIRGEGISNWKFLLLGKYLQ